MTQPLEKLTNTGNSFLLHYTKVYPVLLHYYNLYIVAEIKKEGMKVKSTALAGQRETTCQEEKKRADRHLEFSFCIFCCSNILFRRFCLHRVATVKKPSFGSHSKMETRNLSSLYTSSWLVFNCLSLPHHVFLRTSSNRIVPLFHCVSEEGLYPFSGGTTPAQKIWDLRFFLIILINVVTHP